MSPTPPEEHAGRSAELQRLLDEIGDAAPPAGGRPRSRTGDGPSGAVTARPAPQAVTRSSPAAIFPRRVRPGADRATGGPATEQPGDGSARQRRSGLVRSPINRAEVRSPASARSAKVAPASTKTAVARSLAGRWGPAGYPTALPEQRTPAVALSPAEPAARAIPAQRADPAPPAPPAPPAVEVEPDQAAGGPRPTTAPPAPVRHTQRRTLILAGGVAAAVVAIVAIISIGNRSGSGPASDAGQTPQKVAMVQTTGVDGRATVATVTAPVSTVAGQLVALVQGADGQVRQLAVVTAAPAATSTPTPAAQTSTTASGTSAPAAIPPSVSPTSGRSTASTGTTAPSTRAPSTTSAGPSTTDAAPGGPGDVATVVTGLTTLTGWEPVPTN